MYSVPCDITVSGGDMDEDIDTKEVGPNAVFIAHARQDIPELLAALNKAQCAYAFEADSLSYETKRFREALMKKDEEIRELDSNLQQRYNIESLALQLHNEQLVEKDAEIEALETVLSAGQMLLCQKDAEITQLKADLAQVKLGITKVIDDMWRGY